MQYIDIINWSKYQHYKDRRPPWIKLLTEVIDEFDPQGMPKKFYSLPDTAKLTFVCLLCLRSRYDLCIPYPSNIWLKQHLGIKKINLQPLINTGFITVASIPASNLASNPLATCYRNRAPETETETETETENRGQSIAPDDKSSVATTLKKLGITFNFETGNFEGITTEEKIRWSAAYPAVDIDLEIKRAALWMANNPHKKKSRWGRFLTNWFSRTQEKGGSVNGTYNGTTFGNSSKRSAGQVPSDGSQTDWVAYDKLVREKQGQGR